MNIVLINYADDKYIKSRQQQKETALSIGGFNKVIEYHKSDIDSTLLQECSKHFENKRGAGYWVWKPYFILKTLDTLNDGDVLVYCDSGAYFKKSVLPYVKKMRNSIMLFLPYDLWLEKQYTKMDILKHFNFDNDQIFLNSVQIESGLIMLKKSKTSYKFIKEWFELCKDYHLVSDEPSIERNIWCFRENRHDQSLLSALGRKYQHIYDIDIEYKPFVVHHKSKE